MTARLGNIAFDCDDVLKLAAFWSAVLGRPLDEGSSEWFASIGGTDAGRQEPAWYFNKVPEGKREVQQPMLTRAYASLAAGKRLAPQRCAGRSEGHAAGAGHWAAGRVTSPGEAGYSEGKPTAGCGTG